ncbi:MAG: IS3 family transposase [Proteobacteria bacterium]|jgi:putative transposase|nr:IS3 family transposase [Pseudomonadota bacterium]
MSIRRLAVAFDEPPATVARWVSPRQRKSAEEIARRCPVSSAPELRDKVRALCDEPRHKQFGHPRVRVLLRRRFDVRVSRETVRRIMRDEGLSRPRIWHRPSRPHHVEKARPTRPNEFWQVDMTSFQLSDLTPLFLVVVIDCFTREIAGYTLDRRCRAREWIAAVRTAIEQRGITEETARALTLRSDNGSQPCSKDFVEYLGSVRVKGQYTGYNAPDDNAFVERVIRTIKEEEVWPNLWDTVSEAREAIENYVAYYNNDRIHSALDYATPKEFADASAALKAA